MANEEHLKILQQGVEVWNKWRHKKSAVCRKFRPDLKGADFRGRWLREIALFNTDLQRANFEDAVLSRADFYGSYLHDAKLNRAYLRRVKFEKAKLIRTELCEADLKKADFIEADLSEAKLQGAYLQLAQFVDADLTNADLSDSCVYGASAWKLKLKNTNQTNLIISADGEPKITVDNIEVAQFVYLLLNNEKIRNVIDTIGEKGVLILGRFTEERKAVLDAIREKLRELGFVPMMLDFEKPTQRDFTETIKTLAGLSRFIIADITNPKSSPLELQATMPDYMIPFVPIIQEEEEPFAMFQDLQQKYGDWVLDVLR